MKFKDFTELVTLATIYYLFEIREKKDFVKSMNKEIKRKCKDTGTQEYLKLMIELAGVSFNEK